MSYQEHSATASAASAMPWWPGSQQLMGESLRHLKHAIMESSHNSHGQDHPILAVSRQAAMAGEGGAAGAAAAAAAGLAKFSAISGCSNLLNGIEFQGPPLPPTAAPYPAMPGYQGRLDLALGQSMVGSSYRNAVQSFAAAYPTYEAHSMMNNGRVLLPSVMDTEETVYVNPKQVNGILRRRLARAKAVRQNRISTNRKPYLHESRHLHALRRMRGSGGRFLNTKNCSGEPVVAANQPAQKTNTTPSSEESHSENVNKNSGNGGLNTLASEATSVYQQGEAGKLPPMGSLQSPPPLFFPSMTNMMDGSPDEAKWVTAAAHGICDLLKV